MPRNSHKSAGSSTYLLGLGLTAVATAAVATFAIFFWPGNFKVVVGNQGGFELTFTDRQVDLNKLLDTLLKQTEHDDSKRRVALNILHMHDFDRVPSQEAAVDLREIKQTDATTRDFDREVRKLLYDLAGPFSRPATFQEAQNDRMLSAFEDFDPSSPLVAKLWEVSLDWKGIFFPRSITISIYVDNTLKEGGAATCAGSVLLNKAAQVSARNGFIDVQLEEGKSCEPTSARDLLVGKVAKIWVSPDDIMSWWGTEEIRATRDLKECYPPCRNI
jgi:hypothetical protein